MQSSEETTPNLDSEELNRLVDLFAVLVAVDKRLNITGRNTEPAPMKELER